MFIFNKSKLQILSRPAYDESRIIDIYAIDSQGNPKNSTNHGQQSEIKAGKDSKERIVVYEFFFVADLRRALESGHLILDVKIKNKSRKVAANLFTGVERKPSAIKDAIFNKNRRNRSEIIRNKNSNMIYNERIDLSSFINNFKKKNAKILSDEILFGKKKEVRVTSVETAKKSGKNFLLSQVHTNN